MQRLFRLQLVFCFSNIIRDKMLFFIVAIIGDLINIWGFLFFYSSIFLLLLNIVEIKLSSLDFFFAHSFYINLFFFSFLIFLDFSNSFSAYLALVQPCKIVPFFCAFLDCLLQFFFYQLYKSLSSKAFLINVFCTSKSQSWMWSLLLS